MQAKSTDLRITFLGKVYSNLPLAIKISKMVMLGRSFNCLWEAIVLAGILNQQKSIFKLQTKAPYRNQADYFRVMWDLAQGSQSDTICMLSAYRQWYRRFGSKKGKLHYRYGRKWGAKSQQATEEEKLWCLQKFLDPHMLREVELLVREVVLRLVNLGIVSQD